MIHSLRLPAKYEYFQQLYYVAKLSCVIYNSCLFVSLFVEVQLNTLPTISPLSPCNFWYSHFEAVATLWTRWIYCII